MGVWSPAVVVEAVRCAVGRLLHGLGASMRQAAWVQTPALALAV